MVCASVCVHMVQSHHDKRSSVGCSSGKRSGTSGSGSLLSTRTDSSGWSPVQLGGSLSKAWFCASEPHRRCVEFITFEWVVVPVIRKPRQSFFQRSHENQKKYKYVASLGLATVKRFLLARWSWDRSSGCLSQIPWCVRVFCPPVHHGSGSEFQIRPVFGPWLNLVPITSFAASKKESILSWIKSVITMMSKIQSW